MMILHDWTAEIRPNAHFLVFVGFLTPAAARGNWAGFVADAYSFPLLCCRCRCIAAPGETRRSFVVKFCRQDEPLIRIMRALRSDACVPNSRMPYGETLRSRWVCVCVCVGWSVRPFPSAPADIAAGEQIYITQPAPN